MGCADGFYMQTVIAHRTATQNLLLYTYDFSSLFTDPTNANGSIASLPHFLLSSSFDDCFSHNIFRYLVFRSHLMSFSCFSFLTNKHANIDAASRHAIHLVRMLCIWRLSFDVSLAIFLCGIRLAPITCSCLHTHTHKLAHIGLFLGYIFNYIATHVRRTTSCVFLFITCRIDMLEYRQFQWCYGDNSRTAVSMDE